MLFSIRGRYQGCEKGYSECISTVPEGDIPTPWMPNGRIRISKDCDGGETGGACKVGHAGVIGYEDAASLKKPFDFFEVFYV